MLHKLLALWLKLNQTARVLLVTAVVAIPLAGTAGTAVYVIATKANAGCEATVRVNMELVKVLRGLETRSLSGNSVSAKFNRTHPAARKQTKQAYGAFIQSFKNAEACS
jgi:hypothetical protein